MIGNRLYNRPVAKVPFIHLICRACGWTDVVGFRDTELANEVRRRHEDGCERSRSPQHLWAMPPMAQETGLEEPHETV